MTGKDYDLSDPEQYEAWLAETVAEIRTPEYVEAQNADAHAYRKKWFDKMNRVKRHRGK